jgi:hypothetical protein
MRCSTVLDHCQRYVKLHWSEVIGLVSERDSDAAEIGDNAVRFESDECRGGGSEGHG